MEQKINQIIFSKLQFLWMWIKKIIIALKG
jgi:hypothetical protein